MLPGKLNNDMIEMHFYLMRRMSGANMALDVKSFCQNAWAALMKDIVSLCCNVDKSFDRDQHKQFHSNMNNAINLHKSAFLG